jgi:hypothetical protein
MRRSLSSSIYLSRGPAETIQVVDHNSLWLDLIMVVCLLQNRKMKEYAFESNTKRFHCTFNPWNTHIRNLIDLLLCVSCGLVRRLGAYRHAQQKRNNENATTQSWDHHACHRQSFSPNPFGLFSLLFTLLLLQALHFPRGESLFWAINRVTTKKAKHSLGREP